MNPDVVQGLLSKLRRFVTECLESEERVLFAVLLAPGLERSCSQEQERRRLNAGTGTDTVHDGWLRAVALEASGDPSPPLPAAAGRGEVSIGESLPHDCPPFRRARPPCAPAAVHAGHERR